MYSSYYCLFQNRRALSIFLVTSDENKIESCGFLRWKEEIETHRFICYKFVQYVFWSIFNQFSKKMYPKKPEKWVFVKKKRQKTWNFHLFFSKNQLEARTKMYTTLERYKLTIWALRHFVDLRLPVLIHSWKSNNDYTDRAQYIDFERPRLKTLNKSCG